MSLETIKRWQRGSVAEATEMNNIELAKQDFRGILNAAVPTFATEDVGLKESVHSFISATIGDKKFLLPVKRMTVSGEMTVMKAYTVEQWDMMLRLIINAIEGKPLESELFEAMDIYHFLNLYFDIAQNYIKTLKMELIVSIVVRIIENLERQKLLDGEDPFLTNEHTPEIADRKLRGKFRKMMALIPKKERKYIPLERLIEEIECSSLLYEAKSECLLFANNECIELTIAVRKCLQDFEGTPEEVINCVLYFHRKALPAKTDTLGRRRYLFTKEGEFDYKKFVPRGRTFKK